MTYYVVRLQLPHEEPQTLVFVLDRNQNLMEQVSLKVGNQFVILSVQLLGIDWPL